MTSISGSGGAIYKDGEPVSEQLSFNESITIPSGNKWKVTATLLVGSANGDFSRLLVNGQAVVEHRTNDENSNIKGYVNIPLILKGGDTISTDQDAVGANISGWSL